LNPFGALYYVVKIRVKITKSKRINKTDFKWNSLKKRKPAKPVFLKVYRKIKKIRFYLKFVVLVFY
tara:strand:- start:814 stop:1011 length:198 start_codon:yes stop_codon:yes gene_type:complete